MIATHRKGWLWRRKVELWFAEARLFTQVRGIGEAGDDILVQGKIGYLSVECKNCKAITLSEFVDQANRQAEMYPPEMNVLPIAVVHRKGRDSVDDGYVVMSGAAFIELITR